MEEQNFNIKTLFRRLDKDNDEFISIREFKGAVEKIFGIHVTDDEFERVFEKFDMERTYKLSLESFEEAIYGEKKAKGQLEALIRKIKDLLL
jgi:Ca2+-binding EF-hand superfamily protein